MAAVKIGRRLVFVLLLAVTPVVAVYTYWSVRWSGQNYVADLKRETRATMRGIAPILAGYAQHEEWVRVRELFERMGVDGTKGALLRTNGELWYSASDFPAGLIARAAREGLNTGSLEFEQRVADRYWFCRVVPLSADKPIGYLLVAQDWTNIGENLRQRMLPPVGAALVVMALIGALIPMVVSRYVSKPLAELSRKVMRFSTDDEVANAGDEVKLLSEEFQRLGDQLTRAHADLLGRHRYELELNHRLQRADRLATIGTLASGLAHEIGTPMGVMRTRTELLLQGNPSAEKTREGLEIVLGQIERISKIVRMLLDYARGREARRVRYDLRIIIEHVLKLVETQAKRGSVRILLQTGTSPLTVECDPDQLQQVFVNLALNAFDAMAPTGGTLKVDTSIETKEHDSSVVKVSFEDTGPGVPQEFRERLFDPFFTTKPPGKGTGMGLSVSQSIIRDHKGEITFEAGSAGARFSVMLPMANRGALQMERAK
jgi:two-component system, NtrC family, sensor kinase